ncbi:putative endonuclease related to Holliday junction resolvase (plasmid) [Spongiibacter sp. IMCC21906]|uniref:restriction endonuclease n=1 Tax=Spongiibacter sp. IMCC21906 TaxID=1620392 RepID=UPI00062DFAFF|nr:restriction endonuclease [Spongiibacter sp. IMCC21906]AKH70899.1 putative endonuclease related to Holliday junction resolvase [Spongiibacter sp. IMCC21906]
MKGLGRRLRNGAMFIEADEARIKIITDDKVDLIQYSDLKYSDWGYIYEKYIAQSLTDDGYRVIEHGLAKGFNDGGIDLIAEDAERRVYIQCKYLKLSKISRKNIEIILYTASNYLSKVYEGKRLDFWLVVPSLKDAFSTKKTKSGKETYPVMEYFLAHNNIQSKVRLSIKEIGMDC